MIDRKIKWLMYTVLVGLIPVGSRLLIWVISQDRNKEVFSAADFVAFGLILHISNINEIEHLQDNQKSWKTIQNGTSIAFISWYGVLFAAYLLGQSNPELIDAGTTRNVTIAFSIISFLLSFSVYDRISKVS